MGSLRKLLTTTNERKNEKLRIALSALRSSSEHLGREIRLVLLHRLLEHARELGDFRSESVLGRPGGQGVEDLGWDAGDSFGDRQVEAVFEQEIKRIKRRSASSNRETGRKEERERGEGWATYTGKFSYSALASVPLWIASMMALVYLSGHLFPVPYLPEHHPVLTR